MMNFHGLFERLVDMARSVVDVVLEGSGVRISWSDNSTDQYVWNQANNRFALRNTKSGTELSVTEANEIIASLSFGFNSETLWSHIFGLAGDNLSAASVGQIGDAVVQDTWTRIIYDVVRVESESDGLSIDSDTGIFTFTGGEWKLSGTVQIHKTTSSSINLMIQLWNEITETEEPNTFRIRSTAARQNAPASIRMEAIIDTGSLALSRCSVRMRVDAATAVFGTLPGDIPAGSLNSAGLLNITRLG